MDKKGDYKWGIILSLIMVLLIIGMGMFFLFNEYFTGKGADWEKCRQSI
jgi:hypothetical protein